MRTGRQKSAKEDPRYCGNVKCKKTTPHAIKDGTYTCQNCGTPKSRPSKPTPPQCPQSFEFWR